MEQDGLVEIIAPIRLARLQHSVGTLVVNKTIVKRGQPPGTKSFRDRVRQRSPGDLLRTYVRICLPETQSTMEPPLQPVTRIFPSLDRAKRVGLYSG